MKLGVLLNMLSTLGIVIIENSKNTMSLISLWKVTLRRMNFLDGNQMSSKVFIHVNSLVPLH